MSNTHDRILLIDANALVHRAYHAFPPTLVTAKGEQVNAAYGFTRLLLQVLKEFHPEYVVCAFDTHAPTFRHQMYSEYKATRKKPDEALVKQFPLIKDILKKLNIPTINVEGLEADDILGVLAHKPEVRDLETIIVTGDRDLMQLIDDKVAVYLAGSNFSKSVLYHSDTAAEKFGFPIKYLVDYKALLGDPSDNIPGVKGIGEKTATTLIQKYQTLDNIYKHLDELPSRTKTLLETDKSNAYLSQELATIIKKHPVKFSLNDAVLREYDKDKVTKLFFELEFKTLISKLPESSPRVEAVSEQLGLMDITKPVKLDSVDSKMIDSIAGIEQIITTFALEKFLSIIVIPETVGKIWSPVKSIVISSSEKNFQISANLLKNDSEKSLFRFLATKKIVTANAKEQLHYLFSSEIFSIKFDFDVLLAGFLLNLTRGQSTVSQLAFSTLGLITTGKLLTDDDYLETATVISKLYPVIITKLDQAEVLPNGWGLKKLFFDLEMPLIPLLLQMERAGIHLDQDYLRQFALTLDQEITKLQTAIYEQAGTDFNINSPKQLSGILFEKMHLPGGKKTKSGAYSTNEKQLINLLEAAPIIKLVLEYRELSKLRSTYTDALIALIDPNTARIHTTYSQVVASTGRLSSEKPNLQNIPVATENGRQIRRSFTAAPGSSFLFFDYSQQELRLLAHFSEEDKLIAAFSQNHDIHALTAAMIFKKELETVTKAERRIGKTVNFGVIYGISAYGLSEQLKIPRSESQSFIDLFFTSYPKVHLFYDQLLLQARQDGFITTMLGRKRDASGLVSPNFQIRNATEREIINFPLQGSAADMMKLAMLKAGKLVNEKYQKDIQLLLQVHDELIFEVAAELDSVYIQSFIKDVYQEMTTVLKLSVPMKVDVEFGKNLADKEKFSI